MVSRSADSAPTFPHCHRSDDKNCSHLDITSGKEVATLNGHTGKATPQILVRTACASSLRRKIITGRIWDIFKTSHYKNSKPLLKGHTDEVYSAAFSRDSKRIVTASEIIRL